MHPALLTTPASHPVPHLDDVRLFPASPAATVATTVSSAFTGSIAILPDLKHDRLLGTPLPSVSEHHPTVASRPLG